MWLEDLALHLRAMNHPDVGTNVFVHALPSTVETGVMLASGYQGMPVDPYIPEYYKGPMQIIARAKKSAQAEAIASAISKALTMEEVTVGNIIVRRCHPRHLPVPFPRSNGDYFEASVNFDICFLSDMA